MKNVKLMSGAFNPVPVEQLNAEIGDSIDVDAMLVYVGNFESMSGHVEVLEEHIDKLFLNYNTLMQKMIQKTAGILNLKYCAPIQLDHSVSARDTVGRVTGPFTKGVYMDDEGMEVPCLFGRLRILGRENVEKVRDGRWTHFSIGADLDAGKLSELTITPFPAAPNASLLAKKPVIKGEEMFKKLMSYLTGTKKLSEVDASSKLAQMSDEEKSAMSQDMEEAEKAEMKSKMKKHLMDRSKMSEEDADKKLSEMDDVACTALQGEMDAHEKQMADDKEAADKLAAEETNKAKAQMMAANKEKLSNLSASFKTNVDKAKLTAKKAKIIVALSGLRNSAKITPAEVKKIDLDKLSTESESTIKAVIKSYEDREPVILVGMMGSKKAVEASSVYKQSRMSKLEAETRANMPLLAGTISKEEITQLGSESRVPSVGAPDHVKEQKLAEMAALWQQEMTEVHSMMDEGKLPEAKERMSGWLSKYMGLPQGDSEEMSAGTAAQMSALADSLERVQNDYEQVIQLTSSILGANT